MRSNRSEKLRARLRPAAAALAVALGLAGGDASAGSTDPVLVVGHAELHGAAPARVLDLVGSWGFDDMLQLDYPLSVVVHQGSSYVRYPFGGAAVAGTFAGLSDGLAASEIAALEAGGSAAPGASMTRLALHEMSLALPSAFPPGPLEVVLYVTLPGEGTFLSNSAQAGGGS